MLSKLLIANRGEIAVRIVKTAKRMGIATVAVYSDADRWAMHVTHADEAVAIGGAPATESYLRIDRIIEAARTTGADAIHPGYGFLSENADFAEAVVAAGLTFVGPSAEAMRRMGGKAEAKAIAEAAGVPVVPGWRDTGKGSRPDAATLSREAKRIGYPVLIKAVAGGGGRGMRLVERDEDFREALESAEREALSSFGDARVLIEKLVVRPRHIEVQVFGDRHGNVVHLFERDCTLQRRNQKVIEEAPAPGMSAALRKKVTDAAVACAKAVNYEGAGTVEFLVEGGTLEADAPWYFIEMNTRLQVEHPVTEAITGLDLVEWQLRVAAGERLPLTQKQITIQGHAVEARLYAEDPANGFRPSIGNIVALDLPGSRRGTRVDTGFATGDTVSPFYDAMLAKIITNGTTREEAFEGLRRTLSRSVIFGPRTNLGFLNALVSDPDVLAARLDTGLIGRKLDGLVERGGANGTAITTAVAMLLQADGPVKPMRLRERGTQLRRVGDSWDRPDAFQLGGSRRVAREIFVDGRRHVAIIHGAVNSIELATGVPEAAETALDPEATFLQLDRKVFIFDRLHQTIVEWPTYDVDAALQGADGDVVRAPINGRVSKVFVETGQKVAKGERVAVVEAMKMEHVLHAPRDGAIASVAVSEGAQVSEGTLIAALAEEG